MRVSVVCVKIETKEETKEVTANEFNHLHREYMASHKSKREQLEQIDM